MIVRFLQLLYSGLIDAGVTAQSSLTFCMHPSFNFNHKFNKLGDRSCGDSKVRSLLVIFLQIQQTKNTK